MIYYINNGRKVDIDSYARSSLECLDNTNFLSSTFIQNLFSDARNRIVYFYHPEHGHKYSIEYKEKDPNDEKNSDKYIVLYAGRP